MGVRTNILGLKDDVLKRDIRTSDELNECADSEVCLGKLVAYVDTFVPEKMETVKWLEDHLNDDEDKEYIKQYKDHGYCGEYITFNQIFTREEMRKFIEAYYNDKINFSGWQNVYGLSDIIQLLEEYSLFAIEWCGA